METSKVPQKSPKLTANKPTHCPWTSKAPLCFSVTNKIISGNENKLQNNFVVNNKIGNNNSVVNNFSIRREINPLPSVQESSSQFFRFLRLMELFPDVHPATLHTVLFMCKGDFFYAVDKLLFAKKYKQMQNRRNTAPRILNGHRFHPYCYYSNGSTLNPASSCQNSVQQKGQNVNFKISLQNSNQINNTSMGNDQFSKSKHCEDNRNPLTRNWNKNEEKQEATRMVAADLQIVTSPECKLPIYTLSPIAEDLSSTTNDDKEEKVKE